MKSPRRLSLSQKTILSVIILAVLATTFFTIYTLNIFQSPDISTIVKSNLSTISADYYEHYYFPDLESSIQTDLSEALSHYVETGFARVPLRQLLHHTSPDDSIVTLVTNHCDLNHTFVHFYPEPPFTATSYHTSFDYSCNF